jgi:hypothetical protein
VGYLATDKLLLLVEHASGLSITPDVGWTATAAGFNGGGILRLLTFDPLVSGASSSGPWTFTLNASSAYAAAIVAVAADTANGTYRPTVDGFVLATGTSISGAAVRSVDTLLITVAGIHRATAFSASTGTERVDIRTGDTIGDYTLWVETEKITATLGGTTPNRTFTDDNPFGFGALAPQALQIAVSSGPPPVDWTDGFDAGNFNQWASVEAAPGGVQILSDTPPATVSSYARFTANDADIYPVTSTENPRAQLNGPRYIFDGDERWVSFSVRFPLNFPSVPYFPAGWLIFWQWYGPPYSGGGPPISFGCTGEWIQMQRNSNHGFDHPWQTPLVRGAWLDFDMRTRFSRSSDGWLDLWYRGQRQLFPGGKERLSPYYTMNPDMAQGVEMKPCVYRLYNSIPGNVVVDIGRIKHHATSPPELTTAPKSTVTVRSSSGNVRVSHVA